MAACYEAVVLTTRHRCPQRLTGRLADRLRRGDQPDKLWLVVGCLDLPRHLHPGCKRAIAQVELTGRGLRKIVTLHCRMRPPKIAPPTMGSSRKIGKIDCFDGTHSGDEWALPRCTACRG